MLNTLRLGLSYEITDTEQHLVISKDLVPSTTSGRQFDHLSHPQHDSAIVATLYAVKATPRIGEAALRDRLSRS